MICADLELAIKSPFSLLRLMLSPATIYECNLIRTDLSLAIKSPFNQRIIVVVQIAGMKLWLLIFGTILVFITEANGAERLII